MEKIKKDFEANLLDGASINDCGKAMIDAKECWEFIEEAMKAERKAFAEWLRQIKLYNMQSRDSFKAKCETFARKANYKIADLEADLEKINNAI